MNRIDENSIADIVFQLKWSSDDAAYNECYAARGVNLWRDWLPANVRRSLMGKYPLDKVSVDFSPGELFGKNGGLMQIDRQRFSLVPKTGRFYPQGRISGLPGVFPQNIQPFRCVGVKNGGMDIDLAHPLTYHPLFLTMTVGHVTGKENERGGSSIDWVGLLTEGPGMQSRWRNTPTDFFSDDPFKRKDEQPDNRFYGNPRLVHHLDQTAREIVTDVYRRFIKDGMQVLDLMSSWASHLPETVKPARVSGLGLNRTELKQNPHLTDLTVHDLNTDGKLPYDDASFDVAICSLSVEYLIRPVEVFKEVGRVLKSGGHFVVVFSNRWFPSKVVQIWEQLHEFERAGLVMEYFFRSTVFDNLGTYSMRGLPRPREDKYAGELLFSDPVYAVWGTRVDEWTNG